MSEGWISLHRKIKDHWVWQDAEYFRMWVDLLMKANHAEKKILMNKKPVTVKRGEFITSLVKLAKENKCSVGRVRRFLEILKNDSMIDLKTTRNWTQITICNYSSYQDSRHTGGTPDEHPMNTGGTPDETNNNYNNVNNDNNENKKDIKKSDDFLTELILLFSRLYKEYKQTDYIIVNEGKERSAIGKLLNNYKKQKKTEVLSSEQTKKDFEKLFRFCFNIKENFIQQNISPSIILNQINKIRELMRNGNNTYSTSIAELTEIVYTNE